MGVGAGESLRLGHEELTGPNSEIYGVVKPAGYRLFMAWIYLSRADSPPLLLKTVKSKRETVKARLLALRVALADTLDELRWRKYTGMVLFYVEPGDPQTALELNSLDQGDLPDGREVPHIAFTQGLWERAAEPAEDVPEPGTPEEVRRKALVQQFIERVGLRYQARDDYLRMAEEHQLENRLGEPAEEVEEFLAAARAGYIRARMKEQRALNRLMELEGEDE